jgi:multiple antibiotic resistance protein
VFGISLDAFSVAGGGVLMFIGFSMLQGTASPSTPENAGDQGASTASLGRLILFAASPGTITGVITIVAAHRRPGIPITALSAIAVVLAVTWLLLLVAATRGGDAKRPGLARDMVSRYMGLIIIAMGIQFALKGYKAFMA